MTDFFDGFEQPKFFIGQRVYFFRFPKIYGDRSQILSIVGQGKISAIHASLSKGDYREGVSYRYSVVEDYEYDGTDPYYFPMDSDFTFIFEQKDIFEEEPLREDIFKRIDSFKSKTEHKMKLLEQLYQLPTNKEATEEDLKRKSQKF